MISHLANTSNDLERPIESFGQLVRDFLWTFGRRLPMRSTFKQDPFSGLIAHFAPLAISVHFHGCLPLQKFLVMAWKISSLLVNMSSTTLRLEDPAIYSGKLKGLRPKVISYGVVPMAAFQEVLWDHSAHGRSLPHAPGQRWTNACKYYSITRLRTLVWPSLCGW